MRICLVSREAAPFIGGGIATYISEMGRALVAAGHETHILTAPYEGLVERGREAIPGVEFHAVDPASGPAALPGAYGSEAARYAMATHTALRSLHAIHRFDYIELPEYGAVGYFVLRAKRSLGEYAGAVLGVRLHTPLYVCRPLDRQDMYTVELAHTEAMEKSSIRDADLLVSASRAMLDRVRCDLAPFLPTEDGEAQTQAVLPLPLDSSSLQGEIGGGDSGAAGGTREVLYYGRLQLLKGVVELVEAGKRLLAEGRDLRFRFIGGDTETGPFGRSMLSHLERLVAGPYRERFVFEPAVARSELGGLVRRAVDRGGVCCFPSRWESFSMACLEALAMGAVVVGADGGAIGEILQDGESGVVFPAGDVGALAGALVRALEDQGLRRRARLNGPLRARALSEPGTIVSALEEHVMRAAERGRAAGARLGSEQPSRGTGERGGPAGRGPRISVIVPFYNLGRYLPETLASVDRQGLRDIEVVVVNDGSTEEESLRLLDRLEERGETAGGIPLRVVHKANGGLGSARNAGFREAEAAWVYPLDADDLIRHDALELLLGAVEREAGVAYASPLMVSFQDDPGIPVSGHVPLGLEAELLLYHNIGGLGAGSLMSREAVMSVGGYDEWLTSMEDWDMWCRLAEAGYRGSIVPEFLLFYRLRPGSLIRTEVADRSQMLRAYLLAEHGGLAGVSGKTLRLYLAEAERLRAELRAWQDHAGRLQAQVDEFRAQASMANGGTSDEARRLVRENMRYRLADSVNDALKTVGVQGIVKRAAARAGITRRP